MTCVAALVSALPPPVYLVFAPTLDLSLILDSRPCHFAQAVTALQANASQLGIAQLYYPGNGIEMFGNPLLTDPLNIRVPDIAVRVVPGERVKPHSLDQSERQCGFQLGRCCSAVQTSAREHCSINSAHAFP